MTHLHGGFVAADSDGNPAVTPNGFGPGETQTVFYTNQLPQMPASLLWFHDHGLGTTRLNVFAGLAAAYILRDEFDTGAEPNPIGIPGGAYEIPLVDPGPPVQRRTGRSSTRPATSPARPGSASTSATSMLVNGKVWPFLDVEPRHVPVPDPERLQRADPEPRHRRRRASGRSAPRAACGTCRCR